MHKKIFNFIEGVSSDEKLVNKLIVSLFTYTNNIEVKNNLLIKSHLINKRDKAYKSFDALLQIFSNYYNSSLNFEQLIELFEFIISPADKIINGAVYTPKYIRDYIVKKSISNNYFDNIRIGDISSGCGGFLFSAALFIKRKTNRKYSEIYKTNLFGLDITNYSVNRSKILLSLLAIYKGEDKDHFNFNLFVGNALNFNWENSLEIKSNGGFDVILGNPPYVCSRNIAQGTRKLLNKWSVNSSGHPDLYITFFQLGIENIKQGGILAYITVNTFFKSVNGYSLREYFQKNNFKIEIIDFNGEQIFSSRTTYTCLCFIKKIKAYKIRYVKIASKTLGDLKSNDYTKINYSTLDPKGWNLSSKNVDGIIRKIENAGEPLAKKFKIRTGIATLKNDIYKFNPVSTSDIYYYLLKDGQKYQIEKSICKSILNTNKITQKNKTNELLEKIIFPYHRHNGNIELFSSKYFKMNFPSALDYLSHFKAELSKRDKGKRSYERWFAYGRNQSLEKYKYKLLFPHICSKASFLFNEDPELLFYNGMAIIHHNKLELIILEKILSTRLFWFYIKNTSKPYSSNYYSLSKNYIKNFGIIDFTDDEIKFIIEGNANDKMDNLLFDKYQINEKERKIILNT